MHFLWLILILHMLLKSYSLKSNLSELTSGPCFISSIKFLKPFETISCTSLTIPGKRLFHSHLNCSLKHQKNIRNLLGRNPSLKNRECYNTALIFLSCLPQSLSSRWTSSSAGQSHNSPHLLAGPGFQGGSSWGIKVTDLLCIYINISNSFLISN